MIIQDVIRSKGAEVVTIGPDHSVSEVIELMGVHNIGAVIVSGDCIHVSGIVSERDIVRHLSDSGADVLGMPVWRIMSFEVQTCRGADPVEEVARTMTNSRVRHLPVVDADGAIVAIISIGDVVKSRLDELTTERDQLIGYINA